MTQGRELPLRFNLSRLHRELEAELARRQLLLVEVNKESGVSVSAIQRFLDSEKIDDQSRLTLIAWLRASVNREEEKGLDKDKEKEEEVERITFRIKPGTKKLVITLMK